MRTLLVCFALVSSLASYAYIPPTAALIRDAMEGRKPIAMELVMRHRLLRGDVADIEERLIAERGKIWSLFKINGSWFGATRENQGYVFSRDWQVPSRSGLVLRTLTSASADGLREALITERFLRRDQMLQYKPGFDPKGDPAGWALKENYLRHDDIFLKRVGGQIGIAVQGTSPGEAARIVTFSRHQQGVLRYEWQDSSGVTAWSFSDQAKIPGQGLFPRRMSLEMSGEPVVLSEIVVIRELKENAAKAFRAEFATASRSGSAGSAAESALNMLLSYR